VSGGPGGGELIEAIGRYEAQLREYGFAAVRDSQQAARQLVSENGLARAGFKTFLRTAEHLPRLKQKMFS
jgi:salicylate hydroxylase